MAGPPYASKPQAIALLIIGSAMVVASLAIDWNGREVAGFEVESALYIVGGIWTFMGTFHVLGWYRSHRRARATTADDR